MNGLLGKKLGMTQIFKEGGKFIPVTVIEAGPCPIIQIKNKDLDGYEAIQLGFGEKGESSVNSPDGGRFKKAGVTPRRFMKELRVKEVGKFKVGQEINVDIFAAGDFVDVTGTSIGKGFQGGMKRWGWKGGEASHGSMQHRRIGSIESGPRLTRVTKGHHMPGHMGNKTITVCNLEILKIDKEKHLLVVKGPVPGAEDSYLVIKEAKRLPKGSEKAKRRLTLKVQTKRRGEGAKTGERKAAASKKK
ncbi:MAG: 50S ribosomal protein L3 [Candidatus Omnitrophica bacterium]|nr:50S ribosomal protein L3 [Candidatus Omnitrophota bacterium]